MEPPEIYLISPRGISREELERMNAEGEKSADELRQEQQNVKDHQQLSKGIKDAVQVNKSFSRDIQRRK